MNLYPLTKTVLSVTNNAAAFLNGITSNTLDQPQNAFLDVHGRIIATFDQIKDGEDRFLILIETSLREAVLRHIEKFVRLAGVKVIEEKFCVYYDLEGSFSREDQQRSIAHKAGQIIISPVPLMELHSAQQNSPSSAGADTDGGRGGAGKEKLNKPNVSDQDFTLFRLRHQIPWPGIDFHNELILNVSEDDYVSFSKGCFLGQEPVSKVHNRSRPTWKLVVRYEDECTADERQKMTSTMRDPQNNKVMGFVFAANK